MEPRVKAANTTPVADLGGAEVGGGWWYPYMSIFALRSHLHVSFARATARINYMEMRLPVVCARLFAPAYDAYADRLFE